MADKLKLTPVLVSSSFLIFLLAMYEMAIAKNAGAPKIFTVNGWVTPQPYPDWFLPLLISLMILTLSGLTLALAHYFHRWHFAWSLIDIEIALYVMLVALISLFQFGPYVGVAVGGLCIPGHGGATCYVGYPTSIILFGIFLLILSVRFPKSALPVMAFNVSFGELLFTVATAPTALYPAHDVFNPSYFQPYITSVWLACVFVMPLVLRRMGRRLRFDWLFVPWFAVDVFVQFWEPYFHTTLWSLAVSDVMIVWQFWVVWRLFGMSKS